MDRRLLALALPIIGLLFCPASAAGQAPATAPDRPPFDGQLSLADLLLATGAGLAIIVVLVLVGSMLRPFVRPAAAPEQAPAMPTPQDLSPIPLIGGSPASGDTIICRDCRKTIPAESRFCMHCGTKLA